MAKSGRRKVNMLDALNLLIEKANVQGYLTKDDLIEITPEVRSDGERLSSILTALRRCGVEVLEDQAKTEEDEHLSMESDVYEEEAPHISGEDTTALYMKEMAQVPLLNEEEELSLAKRIERGEKAQNRLEEMGGSTSEALRRELEAEVMSGLQARDHLIKANTRLVVSIAKRYIGRGLPFLDLIQEGNLGLMKAVKKYEYQRGFRFSTYATWWIRQTITRSIADQGRTIRVPVHMVDRIRNLYRITHEMEQTLGREPTTEELAAATKQSPQKIDWMMRVSWLPLSLESPVNDDEEEVELGAFVEDEITPAPMESAYTRLLGEKIEDVLNTLPPREERILRLRFGLENGNVYTLEEVGKMFGLTRERIRQIEGKALRRLRHPRRARQLKEFLGD